MESCFNGIFCFYSVGRPRPELQARRELRKGEDNPTANQTRHREQTPHKAPHERLHGLGEGRAPQNPQSLPRHAQFQHI